VNGPRTREQVAAIGFYGSGLRIGYASLRGWVTFGVERRIMRAESNVLFG